MVVMGHYGLLLPFGFKILFQNKSILIKSGVQFKSRKTKNQFGFWYQFEMLTLT